MAREKFYEQNNGPRVEKCAHCTRASDLMTISLNRDIVKAINLDNVLERWMMQKNRVIPC